MDRKIINICTDSNDLIYIPTNAIILIIPNIRFEKKVKILLKNITANKIIINDKRMAIILNCLSFIKILFE